MDYISKIDKLRTARGWTVYKLAQASDLSAQTIHQWFSRTSEPSLKGIENVCKAFGITLSDFFAESELIEATPELKNLYSKWCSLTTNEQQSIMSIVDNYVSTK